MQPAMRQTARRVLFPCLGALALLMAMGLSAAPAHAYDGGGAARYADQYALQYNGNYRTMDNDCTNFVSQALHAGGYSFVNPGQNAADDHNWWYSWGWQPFHWGDSWSRAWSFAGEQYNFLMWTYPGGWNRGTATGTSNAATPDGLSPGDVLYYDFDGNGSLDHVSLQVGRGYDATNGWYGDLVDTHNRDHYHAIWTLEPYHASSEAATTRITLVYVDSRNA